MVMSIDSRAIVLIYVSNHFGTFQSCLVGSLASSPLRMCLVTVQLGISACASLKENVTILVGQRKAHVLGIMEFVVQVRLFALNIP